MNILFAPPHDREENSMRKIVRTQSNNTRRIKLPLFLVEIPIISHECPRATVCLRNHYWVITENQEILIHKWFDTSLRPHYMPQANQNEDALPGICEANGLSMNSYRQIPEVHLDLEYFQ